MRKPSGINPFDFRLMLFFIGILTVFSMGVVFYQLRTILLPFVVAVFGTFLLNPIIDQILRIKRGRAIELISIFVLLTVLFLVLNLFGYILYLSIKNVATGLPQYEEKFRLLIEKLSTNLTISQNWGRYLGLSDNQFWNWEQTLGNLSMTQTILKIFGAIVNFISRTMLVIIFMLFLLLGRGALIPKLSRILSGKNVEQINIIIFNITRQIQRYIVAKTVISVATGLLAGVVLIIFNVDFVVVWIILTILLNFIPSIGSIIATILPVFIAFISTGSLMPALPVLILLGIIQFVIGSIIDPRLVGDIVDLSPLTVLFGLIFWGWLWGILGMFLSVPITVAIKIICENFDILRPLAVMLAGKPDRVKK